MTTERFVFDFDEFEALGLPRCPILEPYWPYPPTASGLLERVVTPFLRARDRARRLLVDRAIENLALAGDHMTAQLQFDGGERPRLLGAIITSDRLDSLSVIAGTRLARNSPEGIAIMRATIAASPYQQCRAAHGCGHPCSCPIRNTTTIRGEGS
jgi:hypothetical protein